MTEKELDVYIYEGYLKEASLKFQSSKEALSSGYNNLQCERDTAISSLELALEEAKLKFQLTKDTKKTTKKDVTLLEFEVKKAKEKLRLGKIKAECDFENKYNTIKLEAEQAAINLERCKNYLLFVEAEKDRGFTL